MNVEIVFYEARLRAPLVSAQGSVEVRPLIGLTLTGDDGVVGYGEAAPLPGYKGVSVQDVIGALEAWMPGDPLPTLPEAAAAVEMAIWDLEGKRAGQPVWRLLRASAPPVVSVNATIGAESPEVAAREAISARAAGYTCVKVKVGTPEDLARVTAVREASGPEMAIRLDANGAWSVPEAIAALAEIQPLGIELCEEPVHGVAALDQVARTVSVPIAADETTVLDRRVCDAVCLKISSSGGITGLLRDAERARAAGYEVYLASTLDGPLGIAAALHAAAVIRPDRPCGLATLSRFDAEDPMPPVAGMMTVPSGSGLGVTASFPGDAR